MGDKKKFLLLALSVCMLSGCAGDRLPGKEPEALSKENCRLCGKNPYQGTKSLALLLIHTGQIMLIRLPEYNNDGTYKQAGEYGYFSMETVKGKNGGSRIVNVTNPETGKAHITVEPGYGSVLDKTKLVRYYCESCIRKIKASHLDTALFDCQEEKLYPIKGGKSFVIGQYSVTEQKDGNTIVIDILFDPLMD